ncbi:hypothetical protein OQA88_3066 [Cercophora sp. LCS_1]
MATTTGSYLTASAIATTVAAVAAGYVLWSLLRNVFASPIPPSVPGPFLARLTSKWILLVDLSGYRARTVHALHMKYGPVVRVAPNELSFANKEAIRAIYGPGTTCTKSEAYESFGRKGMFQMQDPEEHRQRQRRMAHVFSAGNLQQIEPLIQAVIDRVVDAIAARAGQATDALHWCRMMALDVSGEVLMGKSFGAFEGDKAPTYAQQLDITFLVLALQNLSPLLCSALKLLPIAGIQAFFSAPDKIYQYAFDALEEYIKANGRGSARRTLLTKLIARNPETGAEPLPDHIIGVELSNTLFAGTDTTGNTATYALYRLAFLPEWQKKLREELRASRVRADNFSFRSLQSLPVLNGVFMETLRLHPAAPSALPRVTTRTTIIGGLQLPAQTLVSMQAYSTQRDPTYFPDPERFDPSRWIAADGTISPGTPDVQEMMLAWGKGSRACIGQYMATMEIKIVLARIIDRFEAKLEGESTHDDMEMTDHFSLVPKGHRCGLIFSEV